MLKRIISLIKKEFLAIWKDPKSRTLIIAPPLMQLIIFANALTMEVKNIDTAVLDMSKTQSSRELTAEFEHSKWFRKITFVQSEKELKKLMDVQKIQLGIEIPNDFEKKIKAQTPVSLQIIVDGRQTNSAGIISSYAQKIITEFYKGSGAQLNLEVRNWFNPNLEFKWYLLVALIAILGLVITLLLTALSIARERELGTFDQLIVSPLTSFEILAGKTVPPLILAVILTLFMTAMALIFFRLPFEGSILWFLISTIIALLSIVGVGLFISSLCKTQQQAILGVFTFQIPAVLLSGFISPIEDMPAFFRTLTYINPIKYYMTITKGLFLKGMSAEDVISNLIPLALIAVLTLTVASTTFKRKLD